MTSECVDNNYLKDTCHLTTIILHLSSEKIVQKKFTKMFSTFKIEKPQNVLYRRGPRHFEAEHSIISLPRVRNLLAKGAKIRSGGKGCENQTLSFFYINPPCVARAVIKNKFKTKRVYSVYSNTDRFQLLTIACSQEHEERNKIMAQQRQQQHFIRSKGKRCQREKGVSNTLKLSFIYSLCHWQI